MEYDLIQADMCPICQMDQPEFRNLKEIDSEGESLTQVVMGDILECQYCGGVVLSIAYPVMDLDEPVFLDWSIMKLKNPAEESDDAKFTVVTSHGGGD